MCASQNEVFPVSESMKFVSLYGRYARNSIILLITDKYFVSECKFQSKLINCKPARSSIKFAWNRLFVCQVGLRS